MNKTPIRLRSAVTLLTNTNDNESHEQFFCKTIFSWVERKAHRTRTHIQMPDSLIHRTGAIYETKIYVNTQHAPNSLITHIIYALDFFLCVCVLFSKQTHTLSASVSIYIGDVMCQQRHKSFMHSLSVHTYTFNGIQNRQRHIHTKNNAYDDVGIVGMRTEGRAKKEQLAINKTKKPPTKSYSH